MLRATLLVLALLPSVAGAQQTAQVWYPLDANAPTGRDAPGQGVRAPGGYSGMPASPNLGDPLETLPRHRYDPAYPTRSLPVEGGGVPVLQLTPLMEGHLIDRAPLEEALNPRPMVPIAEQGQWVSGVPNVVDGDSFGLNGELVRLAGIDAPEVDQLCYRGNIPHRCGIDARAWLASTIEDTRVDCRVSYRDAAERLIATCWSRGHDINAWAVNSGWAVVWSGAPSPYGAIEEQARARQDGMWAFDFRHPSEWRSIMDDERRTIDSQIANGERPPTQPFPYAPFTERAAAGPLPPVYVIPSR